MLSVMNGWGLSTLIGLKMASLNLHHNLRWFSASIFKEAV
jgi:hypothetical protein